MGHGVVTDIQRYSLHDGPGIRTLVFFKGCPLHCLWCANPETQLPEPELYQNSELCILCGSCLEACSTGALELDQKDGFGPKITVQRNRCTGCWDCAQVCASGALRIVGQEMSVDQVLDLVERDRPFYQRSGGGITLSGGEPAAQPEFAIALLRACKDSQILTAIETSGCCDWEILDALLPHLDLVLLDIKHTDPDLHRDLTGVSNQLILSNARRLAKSDTPLQLRTPVIPGYTDDPKNLRSLYQLAADLDVDVQLVPYHGLGIAKYASLGRRYRLTKLRPPSPEYLDRIRSDYGKAVVGLA